MFSDTSYRAKSGHAHGDVREGEGNRLTQHEDACAEHQVDARGDKRARSVWERGSPIHGANDLILEADLALCQRAERVNEAWSFFSTRKGAPIHGGHWLPFLAPIQSAWCHAPTTSETKENEEGSPR